MSNKKYPRMISIWRVLHEHFCAIPNVTSCDDDDDDSDGSGGDDDDDDDDGDGDYNDDDDEHS